jgi:hypothetical protein
MAELRRQASDGDDHRRAVELRQRLDAVEPSVKRLLDTTASGRGRALFAALDRAEVRTFSVQIPLGDSVHLGETAYLWPFAQAFSAESPAGIVAVTAHGIRVIDYRLGEAQEVGAQAYQPAAETRELVGPGQAGSRQGPRSTAQRDLHDRRTAAHLERFLTGSGGQVAELGFKPDWENLLVTGDTGLVAAFVAGMPHALQANLVTAGHTVAAGLPAARVAALVAADLRAARQRRHLRLTEQARDAAFAGDAATYGLVGTVRAAEQGRVRHLLLDRLRHRADSGGLETGEQLVEQTYRAGGAVTLVEAEAAEPLAGGEGVAALLRP